MTVKIIDQELEKVKASVLKICDLIQDQFADIQAAIKKQNNDCLKKVSAWHNQIERMQYNFLEISMWKIMKQQMMAKDLRKSIVYVNIVQNFRIISNAAYQLAKYWSKNDVPDKILELVTTSLAVVMGQLDVTKQLLITEDSEEIKVTEKINEKINAMRRNQWEDIWGMSVKSNDVDLIKILLRSYKQINILRESSAQLVEIAQWIYYMQTGKMYNLVVEENET